MTRTEKLLILITVFSEYLVFSVKIEMIGNNSNFLPAIFATIFTFNVHIIIPASCVYSYKSEKVALDV